MIKTLLATLGGKVIKSVETQIDQHRKRDLIFIHLDDYTKFSLVANDEAAITDLQGNLDDLIGAEIVDSRTFLTYKPFTRHRAYQPHYYVYAFTIGIVTTKGNLTITFEGIYHDRYQTGLSTLGIVIAAGHNATSLKVGKPTRYIIGLKYDEQDQTLIDLYKAAREEFEEHGGISEEMLTLAIVTGLASPKQ